MSKPGRGRRPAQPTAADWPRLAGAWVSVEHDLTPRAAVKERESHTFFSTQVYHACRTAEGAQQAVAAAGGGEPMVCDLADLQSVRAFASALTEKAATLDCLCLNAGVSPSRKVE